VRLKASLVTLAGVVAGLAAAVVAYQSAMGVSVAARPSHATTHSRTVAANTRWLPCEKGWKLEGETCTRVKERVETVHDIPAPAASPANPGTTSVRYASPPVRSARPAAPVATPTSTVPQHETETEPGDDPSSGAPTPTGEPTDN